MTPVRSDEIFRDNESKTIKDARSRDEPLRISERSECPKKLLLFDAYIGYVVKRVEICSSFH
jgi:hypothetical protein